MPPWRRLPSTGANHWARRAISVAADQSALRFAANVWVRVMTTPSWPSSSCIRTERLTAASCVAPSNVGVLVEAGVGVMCPPSVSVRDELQCGGVRMRAERQPEPVPQESHPGAYLRRLGAGLPVTIT
ncbi:hypothetical protein ACFPRL_14385 [Pseudoclavibacter helvolus]